MNFITRHLKRNAFDGIRAGTIVELGAGTGANFAYVPSGSTVIAVEPNLAMHERLRRSAERADVDVELLVAPAESIPLPDDSVDEVIATLVLCTVSDPDLVLAEVRRILRPGGTLRFVEHVAAHPASPRRWVQGLVARPWAFVFEGCDSRRDTPAAIERAGFSDVVLRRRRLRWSVFFPANSAVWGVATN